MLLHFYKIYLRKNGRITDYDFRNLLNHMWNGLSQSQRVIKMGRHWFSMCDYGAVHHDNLIRFFWIDKSLSDDPFVGELDSKNRQPVDKNLPENDKLYNPTFCLLIPQENVLMTLKTANSPTSTEISNFLMKYILTKYKNNKFQISLIPVSNDLELNKITDQYKVLKANFTIDPNAFKAQGVTQPQLRDTLGGISKIIDVNTHNKKATPDLTISLNKGFFGKPLDYNLVRYLRDSLVNTNDHIKDFTLNVFDPNDKKHKTVSIHRENNSPIKFNLNLGGHSIGSEYVSDRMYKYYNSPEYPSRAIDSMNPKLQPINNIAVHFVNNPKNVLKKG